MNTQAFTRDGARRADGVGGCQPADHTVIGTVYVNSKQVTRVNDTISRLQESGRFAIHLLDRDMRMAGFRGCNGAASFRSTF